MPERAHPDDPIWQKRLGLLSTPGLAYLQQRYRFCRAYVKGKRVLDIPCGTGMGFPYVQGAAQLMGVDKQYDAVSLAQERYTRFHSGCTVGDMISLPFASGSFDVVVCLEGIEHVTRGDGVFFLSEASRVLTRDGILVLSCPLSADGQHSGNEYHLYEWSQHELFETIVNWFQVFEQKLAKGPAGPVMLVAARNRGLSDRRPVTEIVLSSAETRYSNAMKELSAWISQHWSEGEARYTDSAEPGFLPTCFAVLAEEMLGTLSQWETARRKRVVENILAHQDAKTGLFGLDLLKQEDLDWPEICDSRYMAYQVTYFAVSALQALGQRCSYPLTFARRFCSEEFAMGWVEGGPWQDPWNHSNRIMFLLRFLIYLAEQDGHLEAWRAFDAVINALLRQQNPATGLWHGFAGCSMRNAVYAAYHFFPFMFWRGIMPPYADRIIDSVLSIQHTDGLFGSAPGGGACEDLDAIDILAKFSLVTGYRARDVRAALGRASDRLFQLQKASGGFPNYVSSPNPHQARSFKRRLGESIGLDVILNRPFRPSLSMVYYSGWHKVGAAKGEADMWAAWFRSLALSLIVSRYPELGSLPKGARFHDLPSLGWHDEERVRNSLGFQTDSVAP